MRNIVLVVLAIGIAACGGRPADVEGVRRVGTTRMFVKEIGAGPSVIVIHGGPVLDQGYLSPHLEPLSDDFRLVFYDQRMSGRTPIDTSAAVSMDILVSDIEALREDIGAASVHLVGHSWGGQLAMRYAIEYPDRVRAMVLVSPMAASTSLWREEETALAASVTAEDQSDRQAVLQSAAFQRFEPAAIEALMRISFRPQVVDTASLSRMTFHFEPDYAQRSERFGALAPELMNYDIHGSLADVGAPTLVIYGAIEPAANLGGLAILESLPDARMEIIQRAGHFSFAEQPEAFLQVVREFLTER